MPAHSVLLFPELEYAGQVDQFRKNFDPLYAKIPPHITLVFPFSAELPVEMIRNHVEGCCAGFRPFTVTLGAPEFQHDGYVWLPVTEGRDTVSSLHDKLYSGILEEYLASEFSYVPHLTIGRIFRDFREGALAKVTDFPVGISATINSVIVEEILADDSSRIVADIGL